MATNPQPRPKQSTKPVSVRDRWRAKTNYAPRRYSGYAPISFAQVAEVGRLTGGKAQCQILYVILTASLGQMVKETEAFNEIMADLKTAELAELAGCDERSVVRELGDLAMRKVILWEQPKKGTNQCTPLFRSWASLSDYKAGPVAEPEPEDLGEENTKDEDKAKDPTSTVLTRKPVFVKAGKASKPIKVECGVESLQFSSDIDAAWSAVVQGGVLQVTLAQKWEPQNGVGGLKKTQGIQAKMRQGCRGSNTETAESSRRSKGETTVAHPRATELSNLFDESLYRWCNKTLSNDPKALKRACDEAGAIPHDALVKYVVTRMARRVTSPVLCADIVRDARKDWESGLGHEKKRAKSVAKCSACHDEPAAIDGVCYSCFGKVLSA